MSFNYRQPYIVVSAFIVWDGKILLIQENHFPDQGKWNLPGGKLEFGEDPIDTAKREAFEEAGIDFNPSALLGINSIYRRDIFPHVHTLRLVLVGDHKGKVNFTQGENNGEAAEIANYKWLTAKEVLALDANLLRYQDIKTVAQNFINKKTYPLELVAHTIQDPNINI